MDEKALAGVRVIEYASLVAGPYCGKLLADMGAEVMKIEEPGTGDEARRIGPFLNDILNPERSILFMYLNTNKRGITLDLETLEGMNTFKRLIENADILIEDKSPRMIRKLGLSFDILAAINPKFIMTSITPFGQTGPYAEYKTHPLNTAFSGGLGYSSPIGEPVKPGGMFAEYACGLSAATGTLAALYVQRKTGMGQHIDISKQETIIDLNRLPAAQYANMPYPDYARMRIKNRETMPPIPCKDGHVVISVPEMHQWHGCVRLMGNPEWAQNKAYDDNAERLARFETEIRPRLTEWAMKHTREEIYHQGQACGCPTAPILSAEDVVKSKQLKAREFFVQAKDSDGDVMTFPGAPCKFSRTPWAIGSTAPSLGQHNELIRVKREAGAHSEKRSAQQEGAMRYPLEGIRIVDFTWAWAGAHATDLLAMLGAEVIKVESNSRIDGCRFFSITTGQFFENIELSPAFNDMNLNKLSINLNLQHPGGVELARELIRISDVAAQNMRPGVMERLGLGYEVLRKVNPEIILLSSSASGLTGPERAYTGYATNFAAIGGLSYITGHPDGPPILSMGEVDLLSATTSAWAVLAALIHRQRTGEGQHIDVSSSETVSVLIGDVLMDYLINGRVQSRKGNLDEFMAPHNCYRCKGEDKWISIAIGTEAEWRALCQITGHPEWMSDPRFIDASCRRQNQAELDKLVEGWTSERTHYEVMETLQGVGVAAVPYFTSEDLCTDPHLRHRKCFVEVEHPFIGRQTVAAPPWKLSRTPAEITRHGPLFGEHNQYVFGELLRMKAAEIERLVKEQVIY
ncbi:MAG: CoA transferase [Dehalococcoidia bacterium]|nr:CoA transferase [Dehalococcoidia bacterium]